MAPLRNEGRDEAVEEQHLQVAREETCVCVLVHSSVQVCGASACGSVCTSRGRERHRGTCDHTQRSNIWQQTAELQRLNVLAAQAEPLKTR